jgi:iron transport multicopper oxidase
MGQYPDGLRGPLIVHEPQGQDPFKGQYDEEVILTVSDWYASLNPVADIVALLMRL